MTRRSSDVPPLHSASTPMMLQLACLKAWIFDAKPVHLPGTLSALADILNCLRIIIDQNFSESIYRRDVELRDGYYIIIWVIHIISHNHICSFNYKQLTFWAFFSTSNHFITQLVARDAPLGTRSANVVGFHTLALNEYILKWLVVGDSTSHPWSRHV